MRALIGVLLAALLLAPAGAEAQVLAYPSGVAGLVLNNCVTTNRLLYLSSTGVTGCSTLSYDGTNITLESGQLLFSTDLFLARAAAANLRLGTTAANPPVAQTLSTQGASGTNVAGANFTVDVSQGTGTGAGGSFIVRTAAAGLAGDSQNALAAALTINSAGLVTLGTGGIITVASGNTVWRGAAAASMRLEANNDASTGWGVDGSASGTWVALTDNVPDIGKTGASRPKDIYLAGSLFSQGANGQSFNIKKLTELTTIAAAATTATAIQIPVDAIVFAVSVRVTTAIPTAATFTVTGTTSGTTFNTAAVSTAVDSTNVGTANTPYKNGAAQTITITPNLTPADNTGRVRVTIHYYDITAPTS